MDELGELVQSTPHRAVHRVAATVRRPPHPWSPSVHSLLGHLQTVGFTAAPRFLGIDEHGREVLEWIEGEAGPAGWAKVVPDEGLAAMARLLRRTHDALSGWNPGPATKWADAVGGPGPSEILCHGDPGPWNIVWVGDDPVALIDWDYAWPRSPISDVAYALEYVAPFRSDEEALRWLAYPEPPRRRQRMATFLEAYGLPFDDRALDSMIDAVILQQRTFKQRVANLAEAGMQPQHHYREEGYLEELQRRIDWSEGHRALFEA